MTSLISNAFTATIVHFTKNISQFPPMELVIAIHLINISHFRYIYFCGKISDCRQEGITESKRYIAFWANRNYPKKTNARKGGNFATLFPNKNLSSDDLTN